MRLITVAHGTRTPAGNDVARRITDRAGSRLGVPAVSAFVELADPLLRDALLTAEVDDVVVPLLLSTGHHLRVDIPDAVRDAGIDLALGGGLGPDPLLADAMADRLLAAGATSGQPVVMVAAGSNDQAVTADLDRAADFLARRWAGPVTWSSLSGLGPRPEQVVGPHTAVVPYLLAPGFFANRAATQARDAGATLVAEVIGAHPCVVDLVVARTLALAGVAV